MEELLKSQDVYNEGTLSALQFRNTLKWLPIGMTEEELDYVMQNSVSYAENGGVNYVKLLMSSQFKTIKENHVFKLSIATQRGFEDYKKKFTTVRRDTELIT